MHADWRGLNGHSLVLAYRKHWSSDPFVRGGYVSNQPGYFTTNAGNEETPVDNLFFAGEHTESFCDYQGWMEGGANAGIRAAESIIASYR